MLTDDDKDYLRKLHPLTVFADDTSLPLAVWLRTLTATVKSLLSPALKPFADCTGLDAASIATCMLQFLLTGWIVPPGSLVRSLYLATGRRVLLSCDEEGWQVMTQPKNRHTFKGVPGRHETPEGALWAALFEARRLDPDNPALAQLERDWTEVR